MMMELKKSDEGFQHPGRTKVDAWNACVNAGLMMAESEMEPNVCQAIQTLNQRAEEKGREIGREIGCRETHIQSIRNLMESMGWTAEETMNHMKVSESDRKELSSYFSTDVK